MSPADQLVIGIAAAGITAVWYRGWIRAFGERYGPD